MSDRRCKGCSVIINGEGKGPYNDYCGWCWQRSGALRKLEEGALGYHREPYRANSTKTSPYLVTKSGCFLDLRRVVYAGDCPTTGWLIVLFENGMEKRFNAANTAIEIRTALKHYWGDQ